MIKTSEDAVYLRSHFYWSFWKFIKTGHFQSCATKKTNHKEVKNVAFKRERISSSLTEFQKNERERVSLLIWEIREYSGVTNFNDKRLHVAVLF